MVYPLHPANSYHPPDLLPAILCADNRSLLVMLGSVLGKNIRYLKSFISAVKKANISLY